MSLILVWWSQYMQGFYCINGTCEVVQQHIGVPLCPILVSGLSGAIFLPILVSDRSGGRKVCLVQYSYLYWFQTALAVGRFVWCNIPTLEWFKTQNIFPFH